MHVKLGTVFHISRCACVFAVQPVGAIAGSVFSVALLLALAVAWIWARKVSRKSIFYVGESSFYKAKPLEQQLDTSLSMLKGGPISDSLFAALQHPEKEQRPWLLRDLLYNKLRLPKYQPEDLEAVRFVPKYGAQAPVSLLVLAVLQRDYDCVRILLEAGAKVNFGGLNGVPPLAVAVDMEDKKLVTQLLSKGANACYRNAEGRSLLHRSVQQNYVEVARALLSVNGTRQSLDATGHEPEHYAATNAMREMFASERADRDKVKQDLSTDNASLQPWMLYYTADFMHRTNDVLLLERLAHELAVASNSRLTLPIAVHDGPARSLASEEAAPSMRVGSTVLQKAVQDSNVALIRYLRNISDGSSIPTVLPAVSIASLDKTEEKSMTPQDEMDGQPEGSSSSIAMTQLVSIHSSSQASLGVSENNLTDVSRAYQLLGTPRARGARISNQPVRRDLDSESEAKQPEAPPIVDFSSDFIVENLGRHCPIQAPLAGQQFAVATVVPNTTVFVRSNSQRFGALQLCVPPETESLLRDVNGNVALVLRAYAQPADGPPSLPGTYHLCVDPSQLLHIVLNLRALWVLL